MKQITTQEELCTFIYKLKALQMEIPSNITLEIDSKELQQSILDDFLKDHNIDKNSTKIEFMRGEYMCVKICFKN